MKNTYQKILAIILLLSVLLGAFSTASFASEGFTEKRRQYMVLYAGRRKGQLIYGACQIL